MPNVRIEFTPDGARQLRSAPGVIGFLESHGTQVLEDANNTLKKPGYRMSSNQGRRNPSGRWAVRVYTFSRAAKRSEAVHHTLSRVLGSQ